MKKFQMCNSCRTEYENPRDRRFHAQPNACPECGPHLELWDPRGRIIASHDDALLTACQAIREGRIVAVKGLGGFHLMVDARNTESVMLLRQRKHRDEKPFALMYPSVIEAERICKVSEHERQLLSSVEAPIVLLMRRLPEDSVLVSPQVAPANPYLGIMLAYTPLHHLMMHELKFAVVATSGNLADEPICIDEYEALDRLAGIADLYLIHNRPIVTPLDDSIVRMIAGREMILRRARGYAPLPIRNKRPFPQGIAVGAHQKSSVAVSVGNLAFVSQHIGDLETTAALESFDRISKSLTQLYELEPGFVAHDMHPDYPSTQRASASGRRCVAVQHHHAHILSCMADNEVGGTALGVAWDGTGYGTDGNIWGGEFIQVSDGSYTRVAHFRPFPLLGGEAAIKEPRRSAIGLLWEMLRGDLTPCEDLAPMKQFTASERTVLEGMLKSGVNCPRTSSAGRLFDVVSSLLGVCQVSNYEGQAAMTLEFLIDKSVTKSSYPYTLSEDDAITVIDWEDTVREIIKDIRRSGNRHMIAAKFHNTMAGMIVEVAERIDVHRVLLSGGCFQNRYLTETTIDRLTAAGFDTYWHRRIPPNDGGIAVGQMMAARQILEKEARDVFGSSR